MSGHGPALGRCGRSCREPEPVVPGFHLNLWAPQQVVMSEGSCCGAWGLNWSRFMSESGPAGGYGARPRGQQAGPGAPHRRSRVFVRREAIMVAQASEVSVGGQGCKCHLSDRHHSICAHVTGCEVRPCSGVHNWRSEQRGTWVTATSAGPVPTTPAKLHELGGLGPGSQDP